MIYREFFFLFQLVVIVALASSVTCRSKDYDDDLGRPYEFGFTIDGQQHRHESKGRIYIILRNYVIRSKLNIYVQLIVES